MGSPSPPVESESDYIIRKFVWHSSDVAHVEAKIFELCKGDFGIPKHHHSAPVKSSNGSIPISNAIFLPSPGEPLEDYHWDITGKSGPPPLPDYRELWVHETNSNADGLSRARTPLELCMTVGHAMLGWLSMMHKGFLHRDVGMPGVFHLFDPIRMVPFVPGDFGQVLGQPEAWKGDQLLQDQVERLQKAVAGLGITDICHGVIQPSDMTVDMKDYYTSGGKAHRPDYYDYMSSGLLRAVRLSEPYLHSPVDDLESFYYTMQWAGVNNDGSDSGRHETDHLDALRAKLSDSADNRFQATLFVHRIRPENQEDIQRFGKFLAKLAPVFKEWYPSILALTKSWRTVKPGVDGADDVSRYYIRHGLVFAYRGVADYLKIVHKHRESLG
ncbi:hypothetical protein BJ322DRAFT_1082482 [Thelephora terrestris]|uniref:Fungal-type protein kinase domain-containing protein n=1 Tax=Thelephora terrestris TaxID=56493 RepID=A0A9P6L3U1_9AGAM|nr:hypothetical protein BJ322DRAFT_1082482 [Thelephora terrestris]